MRYRLTGLGAFGLQAEWEKIDGDREVAYRVMTFLEDRRLLFGARHCEDEVHCVASAVDIRRYLTHELTRQQVGSSLEASLRAMRGASRRFLEAAGPNARNFRERDAINTDRFSMALGELRVLFGLHIAALASAYNLDVEPELATIMQPALDDDGDELDWIPGFQ